MIIEDFENVAEKYNGDFYITKDKFYGTDGSREPVTDLELKIKHSNFIIKITNTTNVGIGNVICLLKKKRFFRI